MTQTLANEPASNSKKMPLAKISPDTEEVKILEGEDLKDKEKQDAEKTLIEATRLLLREFGIRKSGAAIRDAWKCNTI